ncbi:MAG: carboxypeptidase-like regulatory domain-containing protein [Bacteroidales bacterium]|nr:carboxypeptidase-like regulatory domain-containing protein [Bacteroidales bacterium]MBN2762607.1 carboxypeptidase-like regulatory domain-containing protein [Bacteroidales bacterium]
MKTFKCKMLFMPVFLVIMVIMMPLPAKGINVTMGRAKKDTTFKVYTGKVIDALSKKPVVFANVYLVKSSIGTVTNSDGEFILKVPVGELYQSVGFSFIGYHNVELKLSEFSTEGNIIKLEPSSVPIKEVVIRTSDPTELLRMAIRRIDENYKIAPEMLIAFYRETIKQNRNYVAVSEAVLDVYKSSYNNDFEMDRVKIYKGRKSQDVKKMDTLVFKLQGGPRTSFLLDVVKNPGALLSADFIDYYEFKFTGFVTIDGRDNYVIEFDQKDNINYPLYKGKIYLDTKNLAFSRLDFELSEKGIDLADNELVRKKPIDLKVNVIGAHYMINYRVLDDKWYLNHVRSELTFDCKWSKKLFKSTYVTSLEMAVTDRETESIDKFRYRESAKMSDVLADQVQYFSDDDFWGEYNYIKPDESIESAISKLNRRLRRRDMDSRD